MPVRQPAASSPRKTSSLRRVALWAAAAAGVAVCGWFAATLAIPMLQARSAVRGCLAGRITEERAVENLGGPAAAAGRLALYLGKAWGPANRAQAAAILGCCGRAGADALAGALGDGDARVRRSAAEALGRIGAEADGAVSALEKALDDSDPDVQLAAVEALGKVGREAGPTALALSALAASGSYNLRLAAAEALGRIGPAAATAVPVLRKAVREDSGELRIAAAVALCRIGLEGGEVLAPLVQALASTDWQTRLEAAETLGKLGPLARPAAPNLERAAVNDNISDVRAAAATALDRIRARR